MTAHSFDEIGPGRWVDVDTNVVLMFHLARLFDLRSYLVPFAELLGTQALEKEHKKRVRILMLAVLLPCFRVNDRLALRSELEAPDTVMGATACLLLQEVGSVG